LNSWELGVIVLDAQGAILLMNRSAEAIVGKKDGLTAVPAGLAASRPTEAASLTALIRATQRGKRVTPSAGVLKISRERSERPLDLLVAPLSLHRSVLSDRRGATVVFVSDPDAEPTTDVDLLGKLYGLTPAEARLAVLLVRGDDLKSIADHQGVSHNTARTHMKRILEKTHTRRQSELVSLVLRSPLAASGSRKQS
jgi:DNA-binding CsgD family transcriptional regulator